MIAMKKIFFLLIVFLFAQNLFSQQVPRDKVIVEIATGTWCQFCPGAAMGAEDLVYYGHPVGIIEYHNSDPFSNQYSNHRNNYYNVPGYPTANFDGGLTVVGGSQNQSMYPQYAPKVDYREAIPSSFEIDIYGTNNYPDFDILAIIHMVDTYSGTNLKFHLVLTESGIQYSWQGQDHLSYVCRLMVPDQFGTDLDFSSTDVIELNLSFTMTSGWVPSACELVGFVQDDNTKEVLQRAMRKIAFLPPPPPPLAADFTASDSTVCETHEVQFTDISTGNVETWSWLFPGGTPDTSRDQNPLIVYNTSGTYDVSLTVSDGINDSTILKPGYINVYAKPEQPVITQVADDLVSSAEDNNQWFFEEDSIPGAVYQLHTPTETGNYTVTVTENDCISESDPFYFEMTGIDELFSEKGLRVYPSPNNGQFNIYLNTGNVDLIDLRIFNSMKSLVYQKNNIHINGTYQARMDLSHLSGGIYFMIIEGNGNSYIQKIIIQR